MRQSRRRFLTAGAMGAAAAATCLTPVFGQTPKDEKRRRGIALTIGLNRVDPKHYGADMALRGCVNDANDMFAIARDRKFECFEPLLDDKATCAEVASSIERAARELHSGDMFFLHYSGHGASIADGNNEEPDGRDETWCLYDGMMIDDELYLLWSKFEPGVRVVIFSDSCYSGTVVRGNAFDAAVNAGDVGGKRGVLEEEKEKLSFRYIPDDIADAVVERNLDFYAAVAEKTKAGGDEVGLTSSTEKEIAASVLLISGCQDNQLSGDLLKNGVFTSAVKRAWAGGNFKGSWRTFHAAIVRSMPSTQTPNFFPTGTLDLEFWRQTPFTI